MFNQMLDIDRRIEDLQRLKGSLPPQAQQPINIYNSTQPVNDFKAQYLKENEKVEDLYINCKTAFIDLKNGFIAIKELNGDITKYEIVLPKTPEQLRIEELERKVKEYEQFINANNEIKQPYADVNEYNDTSTKGTRKSIPKQAE